jgi:hypothetical protein
MSVYIHEPLSFDEIELINDSVRSMVWSIDELVVVQNYLGMSWGAVKRMLTYDYSTTMRLIPLSTEGVRPFEVNSVRDDQIAKRVALGIVLTDGALGGWFTKKEYTKYRYRDRLDYVADDFLKLMLNKFMRLGLVSYHVNYNGDLMEIVHKYASPVEGE